MHVFGAAIFQLVTHVRDQSKDSSAKNGIKLDLGCVITTYHDGLGSSGSCEVEERSLTRPGRLDIICVVLMPLS